MESVKNVLKQYGSDLSETGEILNLSGEPTSVKVEMKRGRIRITDTKGRLLASGSGLSLINKFVENYWYWEKLK